MRRLIALGIGQLLIRANSPTITWLFRAAKPLATSEIIYLGTPQIEESIYNRLPERGYEIRVWLARYPKDQKHYVQYAGRFAPFIAEAFESGKGRACPLWNKPPTSKQIEGAYERFERGRSDYF